MSHCYILNYKTLISLTLLLNSILLVPTHANTSILFIELTLPLVLISLLITIKPHLSTHVTSQCHSIISLVQCGNCIGQAASLPAKSSVSSVPLAVCLQLPHPQFILSESQLTGGI